MATLLGLENNCSLLLYFDNLGSSRSLGVFSGTSDNSSHSLVACSSCSTDRLETCRFYNTDTGLASVCRRCSTDRGAFCRSCSIGSPPLACRTGDNTCRGYSCSLSSTDSPAGHTLDTDTDTLYSGSLDSSCRHSSRSPRRRSCSRSSCLVACCTWCSNCRLVLVAGRSDSRCTPHHL